MGRLLTGRRASIRLALAGAPWCVVAAAGAQIVYHVDPARPESGDGLTWETAFRGIRGAVTAATGNPAVTEIWVKEGTYHPGASPYRSREGLALYGGFAGDETARDQRDPAARPTILTGNGTRRIMDLEGLGRTAVVDGFTLRDGYSAVDGAAVFGGGATFRRCRFVANRARVAAAWYGFPERAAFIDCVFESNLSEQQGSVSEGRGADFVHCTFVDNEAGFSGTVRTYDGLVTLAGCVFLNNRSGASNLGFRTGGVETHEGTVIATNCTFVGNEGSALSRTDPYEGSVSVVNSIVWDNALSGPVEARFSIVEGGASGKGNLASDPMFVDRAGGDLRVRAGSPAIDAGALSALPADAFDLDGDGDLAEVLPFDALGGPRLRGKRPDLGAFEHFGDCDGDGVEDAVEIAAGVESDADENGVPDACEDCNGNGAPDALDILSGVSVDCAGDAVPDECQLGSTAFEYRADDGVAEDAIGGNLFVDFGFLSAFTVEAGAETVREVRAAFGPGVFPGSLVRLALWSDPDGDGLPDDARVLATAFAAAPPAGVGLATFDLPDTFVGAAGSVFFVGAIVQGTAQLAPLDSSGTAQGASWAAVAAPGQLDPARLGDADILVPIAQAGFAGDWLLRAVAVVDGDCNANGTPDACDILDGTSLDCAEDGVPDECQLAWNDCNGNGVPDDCDLASGVLADCQANGLFDACEIAAGAVADLDSNGVPDECEDCDANGLPDGLDLALGAPDCQGDGVPDRCQLGDEVADAYRVDEGLAHFFVASDAPNMAWLTHFTVEEGRERIAAISAAYGPLPAGAVVRVHLWSDPDGDGDPSDARSLASATHVVSAAGSGAIERTEIPPTFVGPAGTGFFVGAVANFTPLVHYPATKNNAPPSGRSWLVGSFGPIDPDALAAGADEFLRIDDLGGNFVGVWILRADAVESGDCDANGVPDACDLADGALTDADGDGVPDECAGGATCPADLDGDRQVNAADLAALLGAWGSADPAADLDGNGIVEAPDLATLLAAWGACG